MRWLKAALFAWVIAVTFCFAPIESVAAHDARLETIGGTVVKDDGSTVTFNGSDSATLTAAADTAELQFNSDIDRISLSADGDAVHYEFGGSDASQSDFKIGDGVTRDIDDLGAMKILKINLYADDNNSGSVTVYFEGAG